VPDVRPAVRGRNMWHACGDHSVVKLLEGKGEWARELFDRFESLIAACGPYEIAPAKTRVAFMGPTIRWGCRSGSDRGEEGTVARIEVTLEGTLRDGRDKLEGTDDTIKLRDHGVEIFESGTMTVVPWHRVKEVVRRAGEAFRQE
jgi:hypothetical protein